MSDGAISLTTVGLLAPHLCDDNHEKILDAARGQSKRDVERLVAGLHAQPDIPSSVRALPLARSVPVMSSGSAEPPQDLEPVSALPAPTTPAPEVVSSPRRSVVAPIAPKRYLIRITVSEETHRKLERARDLLRHQIPNGDPAAIVDRALTALVDQVERAKFAARARQAPPCTAQPTTSPLLARSRGTRSRSRRIPAAVRRAVWLRDEGRCAFVGGDGRCGEAGFLEFHHVVPFAAGGPSAVDNLQLRCRAHNAYEAARDGIDSRPLTRPERESALASRRAPSGRS